MKHQLKQMQSVATPAEEALLNLERTTDHFRREIHLLLREHGLTTTQYNTLRILRGGLPGGMTCSELGSRLINTDPDITRLLDRLAKMKLVHRRRDVRDRRIVLTEITEEGVSLLHTIGPLLDERVTQLFAHIPAQRLDQLVDLLKDARRSRPASGAEVEHDTHAAAPASRAG